MGDLNQQIEKLLNEMKKMQQVIDHIENDIYSDEGFDFEIVCPYCEYEFVIDANEENQEIECPECKNLIELDWSGDFSEDDQCSGGHCHGCSDCGNTDEDDDM